MGSDFDHYALYKVHIEDVTIHLHVTKDNANATLMLQSPHMLHRPQWLIIRVGARGRCLIIITIIIMVQSVLHYHNIIYKD